MVDEHTLSINFFFDLKSKSKSNSCKLSINQNQIKNHILQIDLKSFLNQIKNQNCTVAISIFFIIQYQF